MKKRHEKGVVLIAGLILVCTLFLILFPKKEGKDEAEISNTSNYYQSKEVTDLNDRAVAQTDSSNRMTEGESRADDGQTTSRMALLTYERSGNQKMIFLFTGILLCYLIVIGPFSYFYTKSIDKMEKMWLIIPAAAIIFGGIVLLFADSFTVRSPQADVLTIDEPQKQTEVYLAVTSAGKKNCRIFFNDQVSSVNSVSVAGQYELMSENKGLVIHPDYVFEKDYLYLTLNQVQEGTFVSASELSVQEEDKILLRNDTGCDFSCVMICQGSRYFIVTGVEQGDEIQIGKEQWISEIDRRKNEREDSIRLRINLQKDEERILRYAWDGYEEKGTEQLYIAAVKTDCEFGLAEQGLDVLAFGLYQQYLEE